MGLSIKRVETERKARAVAERMGVGLTQAIDSALEDKWRALTADKDMEIRRLDIQTWLKEVDSRPRSDYRTLKEIEQDIYDEWGNPI